jgi:hypothetical protein
VLIFGAGLYEYWHPPALEGRVQLFEVHAGVWWGALMTLIGAVYCYYFKPRQKKV